MEIYRLARDISREAWDVHEKFDWQIKKVIGDQFIESVDSIGANIAEGFGRYHYLDKNKFNYNAKGFLFETLHWLNLLAERKKIDAKTYAGLKTKLNRLAVKLNNYISSTFRQKIT